MEEWRNVPSKPGLQASSLGRVRRVGIVNERQSWSKPTFGHSKYRSRKSVQFYYRVAYTGFGMLKVHRLVCEAFHGPAPSPDHVVAHNDENGLNNVPDNLRWATHEENANDPQRKEFYQNRVRNRTGQYVS